MRNDYRYDYSYYNLHDIYLKALTYKDIHKCTEMDLSLVHIDTLFEGCNAQKFIRDYFDRSGNRIDKNPRFEKLYRMIDLITEFRAKHTVASFLLGVAIKKKLHLDTRSWVRLYSPNTSEESFGFFWSVICLLHDAGYHYEYNTNKYMSENSTATSFCKNLGVTYNLLTASNKGKLMEKYYAYRISGEADKNQKKRIDHGVAAGILVYDALMEIYYGAREQSNKMFCGMKISKSFGDFALEISEAIALHNMWIATEKTKAVYERYGLHELVPGDKDLIIYHENEPLRFLLGLIDTIDPVKYFCNTERRKNANLPEIEVIGRFFMKIQYSSYQRALYMDFDNQRFDEYAKQMIEQCNWLGIDTARFNDRILRIQVRKTNSAKEVLAG